MGVTTELCRHLGNAADEAPDRLVHPTTGQVSDEHPRGHDLGLGFGQGPRPVFRIHTVEPPLAPGEPGPSAECRQIDQQHPLAILESGGHPAAPTTRALHAGLDLDEQGATDHVVYPKDVYLGQANQQLAHARRVGFQQGLFRIEGCRNLATVRALLRAQRNLDLVPIPPRSKMPDFVFVRRSDGGAGPWEFVNVGICRDRLVRRDGRWLLVAVLATR